MKVRKRLLSVVAVIFGMTVATGGYAQDRMSLQQCVDYALTHHAEVRNAELDLKIAKAKVGETTAIGLPKINVDATTNKNLLLRKQRISARIFNPNAPEDELVEVAFGTKYDGGLNATLSQLLFDGSYIVGLQASSTYRDLSSKQIIKTKIDRVEAVKKAYYLVLVNGKRKSLFDSNLKRLQTLLNETEAMWKEGFAEKIDVDRVRVNYNNVRVQRDQFVRVDKIARLGLKFQMNFPLDQEIQLDENLEDYDLNIGDAEQTNFSNRIEKQLVDVNIKLAKLNAKRYLVQYLPTLKLTGSTGWTNNNDKLSDMISSKWLSYGVIGLQMNIPIFDGLDKHFKIRQAKLEQMKYENQRSMLQQSFRVEYSQALNELKTSLDQLNVQNQNRNLAGEVFRVTKKKYQEGLGTNQELVDADNSLTEAQTNYFSALYDALVAKVALQKAAGNLY